MKKKQSLIKTLKDDIDSNESSMSKIEIKRLKFKTIMTITLPFISIVLLLLVSSYITKYQPVLNEQLNIISVKFLFVAVVIGIPLALIYTLYLAYLDNYSSKLHDLNLKEMSGSES